MANKRKVTTAVVAGATALALILGGTFAWTSISQQARNEAIVDINPGGRLHDDFNGTNKDVYVENFGDELTGVDIFARIRLDQYMEIGPDAGENLTADMSERNVKTLIGTDSDDVTTWVTYIPGETIENGTVQALENWTWTLGNSENNKPVYLPTFNMNKDSLTVDINGTWQGTVEGDIVHYDDYKVYEAGTKYSGTEVYDWDDEDNTEESDPIVTNDPNAPRDSADVYKVDAQHEATEITSTATVITMQQWIDGGKQTGPFWVYDEDGWAYWAQPIEPQTTTGLLLDAISLSRVPDENYYYGINVVGQFATAGDLNAFANNDGGMTPEAADLLGNISKQGAQLIINGDDSILAGKTATYTATLSQLGVEFAEQPEINFSIENVVTLKDDTAENELASLNDDDSVGNEGTEDNIGISIEGGTVTIAENVEAGTTFDLKAEATVNETNYTAVKTVTVADWKYWLATTEVGSVDKVSIDGVDWYMLAKDEEESKALIWLADVARIDNNAKLVAFGETNVWRDSNVRTWLNQTYLPTLPTLSKYVYQTDITTAAKWNRVANDDGDVYITTSDKVFLLSEADLTGKLLDVNDTVNYASIPTDVLEEYTLGKVGVIVAPEMRNLEENRSSYTRSPRNTDSHVASFSNGEGVGMMRTPGGWTSYVRPAMWVSYTDEVVSE